MLRIRGLGHLMLKVTDPQVTVNSFGSVLSREVEPKRGGQVMVA